MIDFWFLKRHVALLSYGEDYAELIGFYAKKMCNTCFSGQFGEVYAMFRASIWGKVEVER